MGSRGAGVPGARGVALGAEATAEANVIGALDAGTVATAA
jgi:hypothetical protein